MKKVSGNLHLAIEAIGSQNKLAKALGIRQQRISDLVCKKGGHVPDDLLIPIEKLTGIPRQKLRPDLFAGMEAAE